MFSIDDPLSPNGIRRRELLRIGGLSLLGLGLPDLLSARESPAGGSLFGRAKNVIFLYLAGGPPQHETFDPKPMAPVEIRGPFKPICTNIPGIHFCELLPRTAAIADKLAVIRSMSTNDNIHSSSGAWVLTGHQYRGRNARTIQPTDHPYFGSIIKRYKPSEKMPPLSTVWIPDLMRLNENVTPAGQTGGFMGREWDPDRFVGDPSAPRYEVQGFRQQDLPPLRLHHRQSLLAQVDQHFAKIASSRPVSLYNKYQRQAFDLLSSGAAKEAFAIHKEPEAIRERYGRNRWGQCVLLARRLIEAGARMVHVQWPREPGDNAVDNPLWDTHAQNAERMEDVLAPQFDVGFTALIQDLDQRGLLGETLVVAIGEFGRTPKINSKGGRDHWGPVFSFVMAGAGICGGQVYGSSDKIGGHPKTDRVDPGDLTATIFHLIGLNPQGTFLDREGRLQHFTRGRPLEKLLGTSPATAQRVEPTGDPGRVPPFDESQWLLSHDFQAPVPILEAKMPSRPRGWRAVPLLKESHSGFGVKLLNDQAFLGLGETTGPLTVPKAAQAVLAQEVRSPFAGAFTAKIRARAVASSKKHFEQYFTGHFICRLVFFQYTARDKNAIQRKEWISKTFQPSLTSDSWQAIEINRSFLNPKPGQNFSFGLGLGVAILVESSGSQALTVPKGILAGIAIDSVEISHNPKPRNDKVQV